MRISKSSSLRLLCGSSIKLVNKNTHSKWVDENQRKLFLQVASHASRRCPFESPQWSKTPARMSRLAVQGWSTVCLSRQSHTFWTKILKVHGPSSCWLPYYGKLNEVWSLHLADIRVRNAELLRGSSTVDWHHPPLNSTVVLFDRKIENWIEQKQSVGSGWWRKTTAVIAAEHNIWSTFDQQIQGKLRQIARSCDLRTENTVNVIRMPYMDDDRSDEAVLKKVVVTDIRAQTQSVVLSAKIRSSATTKLAWK